MPQTQEKEVLVGAWERSYGEECSHCARPIQESTAFVTVEGEPYCRHCTHFFQLERVD